MQQNRNGSYGVKPFSGQQKSSSQPIKPAVDIKALDITNFADSAEKVILEHKQGNDKISTTQLRGLFSLLTEVREIIRVRQEKLLDENLMSRVQYIKMRFVYAAGRGEKGVHAFMKQSALIEGLDRVKDSVKQFELVCKYMEALVAYHKFYIGGQ